MRRLIVESEATRQVDAYLPRVRVLLSDFPRAMRLLPMVGLVERVSAGEPASAWLPVADQSHRR